MIILFKDWIAHFFFRRMFQLRDWCGMVHIYWYIYIYMAKIDEKERKKLKIDGFFSVNQSFVMCDFNWMQIAFNFQWARTRMTIHTEKKCIIFNKISINVRYGVIFIHEVNFLLHARHFRLDLMVATICCCCHRRLFSCLPAKTKLKKNILC